MGGQTRLIVDHDGARLSADLHTDAMHTLLSHHSLWALDWNRFQEVLAYFGVTDNEALTQTNLRLDEYGLAYINWDQKTCWQLMQDYGYRGFHVTSVALEVNGGVACPPDWPQDCLDFNRLVLNLSHGNLDPKIECDTRIDGERVDFNLRPFRHFSGQDLFNLLKNQSALEKTEVAPDAFGFKADVVDLSEVEHFNMRWFVRDAKHWQVHDVRDFRERGEQILKDLNLWPEA